jgi:hypothetical protein
MKLLIMQFSVTSRHFISLRIKFSPQHPVLKHPQSVFKIMDSVKYCIFFFWFVIYLNIQMYFYAEPYK